MVSKKKSEWPPPGWKVQIKVTYNGRHYKCYINSKTGEKFYSKLAVLRCIKNGKRSNREYRSCGTKQHPKTKTGNNQMHLMEANDSLNLPPGWTLEWKVRQSGTAKGTKYKCITDPSTGSKLYSMPEVYRYLKSRKGCAESSKQAKGESITNSENNCNSVNLHSKRAVLRCIKKGKRSDRESQSHGTKQHPKSKTRNKKMHLMEANDFSNLPPGWILEWKVRQNGAQKGTRYKCITDPSTERKFYSVPEVYRYLKSKKRRAESSKQTNRESIVNFQDNISVNPISPRQPNLKKELPDDLERTTIHDSLSSAKMKRTPSVNTEKTGKGSKRKHFIDEKSPEQSTLVPPLTAISNEAQNKRITRSSSKIQFISSGLEPILSLPGSTKTVHEMVSEQPSGEVSTVEAEIKRSTRSYSKVKSSSPCEPSIEHMVLVKPKGEVSGVEAKTTRSIWPSSKVESSPTCEPKLEKIPLLPEPSKTSRETVPENIDEVYPIGAQSKRRSRSTKVHTTYICEPDTKQSLLLPEPAQGSGEIAPAKYDREVPSVGGQSKRRTRSTAKVKPPFMYESNLEQMSSLPEPGKETLEILPAKLNGAVLGVEAIDDVGPKVHVANVKQNNAVPKETEPSTSLKHKSDVKVERSSVRKTRVNKRAIKDRKLPILSSRSSKKLAEIDEVLQKNANPRLDLVPNEPQQRAQTSQQETSSWAFDVNIPTMLHTQVDSLEKIDYIPQEYIQEILLQEDEGPPGFSHYPRAKITQSTIDQLFEDPFDTIPEDAVEKSPEKHIVPDNQQDTPSMMNIDKSFEKSVLEEPTTLGRNDTHAGSQFCFSSPLWSDPCLEFAFKTLTGDLPLDDNVATLGFMDHQLRTCDQVNNNNNNNNNKQRTLDIGMSRFFQNDETKLAPPLPDDIGFTKPNGFNSHKPIR